MKLQAFQERTSPTSLYYVGVVLLIAALLPTLSPAAAGGVELAFFESPSPAAAMSPQMASFVAFCPAVAAAALIVWARFTSTLSGGLIRALGLLAIGVAPPAVVMLRSNFHIATSGVLTLDTTWDWVIMMGVCMVFVSTYTQMHSRPAFLLALAGAVGGALMLCWMLAPRPASSYERWFGLDLLEARSSIPVVRAYLHNWQFPEGTHGIWYFWWNGWVVLFLLCGVVSLTLALPYRSAQRDERAHMVFGWLAGALAAILFMPVASGAFVVQLAAANEMLGSLDKWQLLTNAVNGIKIVLPPMVFMGLSLVAVSELLMSVIPISERQAPVFFSMSPQKEHRYSARRWILILLGTLVGFVALLFVLAAVIALLERP